MDLLQLEHFLAVVEERSFTRAAERVFRTQPAISQSVKKLEEEVGSPLFTRDVHDLSPTEAGRLLADCARRMLHLRDDAMRQVAELKLLKGGTLAIAAHESAAVYLLPAPLRLYLQRYPDIKVGIYRSRLADIPRQVLDREVDLGFVKEEPAFHELRWAEVHSDQMIVIASPRHPLAGQRTVAMEQLAREPFILHHLCSDTYELIRRAFDRDGMRLRIVAEMWNFENIKSFVREDVGIALVPGVTVREELRNGSLVRLAAPELEKPRRTLMISREQGHVSDCANELVKILRSFGWGDDGFEAPTDPAVKAPGFAAAHQPRSAHRLR